MFMWVAIVTAAKGLGARLGLLAILPGGGLLATGASVASSVVAFFSTTFGRWVGVALIGLALFMWGDLRATHRERAACKAEIAALVAEGKKLAENRDRDIAAAVKAAVDKAIADLKKLNDDLERKVAEYEAELAKRPNPGCRVTPDDLRRLRGL